jgi:hypothetical protein
MLPPRETALLVALRCETVALQCEAAASRCVRAAQLIEASLVARTFHLPYATGVLALTASIRSALAGGPIKGCVFYKYIYSSFQDDAHFLTRLTTNCRPPWQQGEPGGGVWIGRPADP